MIIHALVHALRRCSLAFAFLFAAHGIAAPKAQVVPTKPQPAFWTKEAKLLSYRCKNMKLEVRSRISPSTTYDLSSGMFNEKDCKKSVAALEKKGCFCDDADLKCVETEKIEPKGFACAGLLYCFAWEGESVGILRVKTLGNHVTRGACEKELADLDRE